MKRKIGTRDLVLAALMLAIGLIVPSIFHSTGIPGNIFLPMHIPVLLAGFLLPPVLALIVGVLTPLLSSVLTGMPIFFPMAIIMMFELGVYGLTASILNRKMEVATIPSLLTSMVVGRIVAGLVVFVLVALFGVKLDPIQFVKGGIVTGFPGIIIQLVLVPSLVFLINKYTTINLD